MGSIDRQLYKSEYVTLKVPIRTATNNTNVFIFPDDQELRNKKLMWLEVYASENIPKTIDNKPIVNTSFLQNCFITLESYDGVQFVKQMPILDFQNILAGSLTQFFNIKFMGQRVNWPKCQIQIADTNLVSDTEEQFILVNVGYMDVNPEDLKKMGTSFKDKK